MCKLINEKGRVTRISQFTDEVQTNRRDVTIYNLIKEWFIDQSYQTHPKVPLSLCSLSMLPNSSSLHSVECNGGEDEEWFDCKQLIVSIPRISSVPRNRIFGMQQRTCVCLGNLKEEETFCNSLHLDKWKITFDVLCKRCSFMALLNRTNNAENFNSSTRLEFLPFL